MPGDASEDGIDSWLKLLLVFFWTPLSDWYVSRPWFYIPCQDGNRPCSFIFPCMLYQDRDGSIPFVECSVPPEVGHFRNLYAVVALTNQY